MAIVDDREEAQRVRTPVGTKSRTKQSFVGETNINRIMEKYQRTGLVSHWARQQPRYGDFTNATDYLTAMQQVRNLEALFAELPSKIRNYCANDPAKLLELVYDPARKEEMKALGLIPPGENPTPEQLAQVDAAELSPAPAKET